MRAQTVSILVIAPPALHGGIAKISVPLAINEIHPRHKTIRSDGHIQHRPALPQPVISDRDTNAAAAFRLRLTRDDIARTSHAVPAATQHGSAACRDRGGWYE